MLLVAIEKCMLLKILQKQMCYRKGFVRDFMLLKVFTKILAIFFVYIFWITQNVAFKVCYWKFFTKKKYFFQKLI